MTEQNWALARKRQNQIERARILQQVRAFFVGHGFLEVETPCRIPANAPEMHIDAVAAEGWVLHTSPELAMKRLLAAGYHDLFQLGHVWRQGERGTRHLPEFTLLERYRRDRNYTALMDDCEALLLHLIPSSSLTRQGQLIDLTRPWPRLSVAEAFRRFGPPAFFMEIPRYLDQQRLPYYPLEFPASVTLGPFLHLMGFLYSAFETGGGAFPSSHVAAALCVLFFSWRYLPRVRFLILAATFALSFATVYCRYHYAVDVLAGATTAAVLVPIGEWLYRRY